MFKSSARSVSYPDRAGDLKHWKLLPAQSHRHIDSERTDDFAIHRNDYNNKKYVGLLGTTDTHATPTRPTPPRQQSDHTITSPLWPRISLSVIGISINLAVWLYWLRYQPIRQNDSETTPRRLQNDSGCQSGTVLVSLTEAYNSKILS